MIHKIENILKSRDLLFELFDHLIDIQKNDKHKLTELLLSFSEFTRNKGTIAF